MSETLVARRYATVLFDVARRSNEIERVSRDLASFGDVLGESAELRKVLETPAVPAARKQAILDRVLDASGTQTSEARRLLTMLAERDRLGLAAAITAAFEDLVREQRRVVQAEVTTAVPLSSERRAELAAALGRAVGTEAANVQIEEHLDPSILGGVIAKVGGRVFDASVTRQLERLRQKLAADN